MNKEIDWSNLDLENKSIAELNEMKRQSYSRYSPPNEYMLIFMFSFLSFMMAALMSIMYYHPITAIPLSRFLLFEISFVVVGIGLLPLGNHQRKKSKMHWAEMQNIRNLIKNEFAIRDAKLGIKSE